MKLVRADNNRLKFKGEVTYWKSHYKTVDIDGEIYSREWREEVTKSIEDIRKDDSSDNFYDLEYNFKVIDYKVAIEEYGGFMRRGLSEMIVNYSENLYANAIVCAYESGLLDSRIKGVYTGRGYGYINDWMKILNTSKVSILLESYGSGFGIYYKVNIYEIFKLKYKDIPRDIVEIFDAVGINLKARNRVAESIKMLNKKINHRHYNN